MSSLIKNYIIFTIINHTTSFPEFKEHFYHIVVRFIHFFPFSIFNNVLVTINEIPCDLLNVNTENIQYLGFNFRLNHISHILYVVP